MPTFAEHFTQLGVSIESLIDGVSRKELEYTLYAEVIDINEITKLAVASQKQEQWSVPLDKEKQRAKGKIRLRLIDGARYTMCTKLDIPGQPGKMEVESDISSDMYESIKRMAVDGYVKTRYSVPSNIQGLIWEVDVFMGKSGKPHPWVKIDLEVKSLDDPIPKFPISVATIIDATDELGMIDQKRVDGLWNESWLRLDT